MSLLSSLKAMFSSDKTPAAPVAMDSEEYKGFTITPAPLPEGSQFRVNGTVVKGEQNHRFIRADVLGSKDACAQEMLRKARLTIDQVGDSIFR